MHDTIVAAEVSESEVQTQSAYPVRQLEQVVYYCKAFCEFRTVYENDYLRVPYNNQKIRNEPSLLNSYLLF